ncbi:uncharacterized protein EDB91DRAFT_722885 [Suillus paluster]|uniref:uncharacterized protein n=1 Tax=Suillus paluster TaxID=48578 RepID=UPI001B85DE2C|nr:uncharacterized protein EDB91DRAFT_722885 [Suillus paluster]KAG1717880.1 hypothetical protein EDB91DRAFT_722885 [Suillus paluster]
MSPKSTVTPKHKTPRRTPKQPAKVSESESEDSEMDTAAPEKPKETPKPDNASRSVKRKRVEKEASEGSDGEVEENTGARLVSTGLGVAAAMSATAKLSEYFGVEDGWAGCQIFRSMNVTMKKTMQAMVWIWFTVASASEHSSSFGPNASYNPHSILGITNLFIEQLGTRPDFCHRYPSPGKTYMFLLALAPEAAHKLLKMPRGWIKLAHGLGGRIRVPTSDPVTSVAIHITGVLPVVSDQELTTRLRAIPGVKAIAGGFERVVLENNVATDRVACSLVLKPDGNLPFDHYSEKFEHALEIGGMPLKVERRTPCLVCGEDTHLHYACSTKQRLVSFEMPTWSFVSDRVARPKPETQVADAPKSKKKLLRPMKRRLKEGVEATRRPERTSSSALYIPNLIRTVSVYILGGHNVHEH